jgi:hypothetical protein
VAKRNLEFSVKESNKYVRELLKEKRKLTKRDMIAGNIIFFRYNAKFKEFVYDTTPFVLILRSNKTHTLGLNFHWIPYSLRIGLIRHIMKLNKVNIKNNKPLEFSYQQLKPRLKGLRYAPCIRLYINRRISSIGVVVSPDRLFIARLRTESFTAGKYTANQLFLMALKKFKNQSKKKIKK